MNIQEHRKWYLDKLMECATQDCMDGPKCPCVEHDGIRCYPMGYEMEPRKNGDGYCWAHFAVVVDKESKQLRYVPLEEIGEAKSAK